MDLHLFNLEREDEGLLFTYWGNALLHTPRQKEDDSTSGKHEESLSYNVSKYSRVALYTQVAIDPLTKHIIAKVDMYVAN